MLFVFFFKQKTAYEMRISDWSSDVCSSDLFARPVDEDFGHRLPVQPGTQRREVSVEIDTARRLGIGSSLRHCYGSRSTLRLQGENVRHHASLDLAEIENLGGEYAARLALADANRRPEAGAILHRRRPR